MKNIKFKSYLSGAWLLLAAIALLPACGGDDNGDDPTVVDDSYRQVKLTPVSGLRIAWDFSSLKRLADKGAAPKTVRLDPTTLAAVYESGDVVYIVSSYDNGDTWSSPVALFPQATHTGTDGASNVTYNELSGAPAIIKLESGDLLAACAVRYNYSSTTFPAAIKTRRITGGGTVLEAVQTVYVNPGCASPALLQLPDGTVQLYFENSPTARTVANINLTGSDVSVTAQQVEVISSTDEGATWTSRIQDFGANGVDRRWVGSSLVASRVYKSNIAPAPVLLDEEVVLALADNNTLTFKPYTVRAPWATLWANAVTGDTPDREYALYELLPDKYLMTNTSLCTLPDGYSLLSYETDEGRATGYEVMEVAISNAQARNFKYRTRPFAFLTAEERAINNTIASFDDNTVVALTTTNYGNPKENSPWYIKGHLIDDLVITGSTVADYPLFVGGRTEARLNAGLASDAGNLYVEVKAIDSTPVIAETGTQTGDGIWLYIDAPGLSLLDVDEGIVKLWVSTTGETARWNGKEGEWIAASAGGISVAPSATADGYELSITIPKSQLSGFKADAVRFGIGLSNYTTAETGITELLAQCQDLRSSTWLGVKFE
ncbi:MAG: hypothetical protein LBR06_04705 [Bacteroidales bacterium]|jgi:hypothetical protein|nr:hypothetical protein [Bacteroidales bacterium]